MKLILEIGGGGIRGVIPSEVCAELEAKLKHKLCDVFDLISGTSTGAILGACLAAGVPASDARNLYVCKGKEMFKARSKWFPWNWPRNKYDRRPIIRELRKAMLDKSGLGSMNPMMKKLKTKFMCTSVSLVDERNHFFKSWERKDRQLRTLNCVARSFAAAYYFGSIDDKENKQVWADGGEGGDNCTIRQCAIESLNMDWLESGESVYILSLGCGHPRPGMPYEKARKMRWVGQVKYYINLARRQAAIDQVYEVKSVGDRLGHKISLDRLDIEIPKKMDKLDAVKYIPDFSRMTLEKLHGKIEKVAETVKKLKNL